MIARRPPMHPFAARYWTWRGNLIINASPDNRPAAQYRAFRDTAIAFVGYTTGIAIFAHLVGQGDLFWATLRQAALGKR